MPSGAKKRKAAKKKKESQQPNAAAALQIHGEEKDSDEGEVSSPASQDNRNQERFIEGEEVVADKPEAGEATVEEERVIHVERESKALDEPEDKNVQIESSIGSCEGGSLKSSSRNSSYSDDGSDAANNSKIHPAVDLVKDLGSLSADNVAGSIPETETCKTRLSEEVVKVERNGAIQTELTKNEEKKLSVDNESASVSEVLVGIGSQRKENEAVQTSRDVVDETLDGKGSTTQGNGVNTPTVDVSTGADLIKDSEVPESSDGQPTMSSALQPVQRTSWKSCCGLFELFSGSSR